MKNFMFIWIPKNAGSSLVNLGFDSNEKSSLINRMHLIELEKDYPKLNLYSINNALTNSFHWYSGGVTFGHQDISLLVKNGYIDRDYYKNTFKFCIVRNPYDRMVSLWEYTHERQTSGDWEYRYHSYNFKDFCKWISQVDIKPVGLYNEAEYSLLNQQVCWIPDDIDYIVRYEKLKDGIDEVCNILEIKDFKLPWENKQAHIRDYKVYYDDKTIEIVSKLYKDDISRFNYKYEIL